MEDEDDISSSNPLEAYIGYKGVPAELRYLTSRQ